MVSAFVLAGILTFLSGLHIFWALGGKWGSAAVFPTQVNSTDSARDDAPPFMPPRLPTLIVAAALLVAALLVLWHVEILTLPLPEWMSRVGVWTLAAVFALRAVGEFKYVGFFKRVRTTAFARMDTLLYSPLCLVLALLAFFIAW